MDEPKPSDPGQGAGATSPPGAAPLPVPSADDRTMAMLAHLLGIFTGFLGPLILYLVKKDQSKFVAFHALQALFFQIAITILSMVTGGLTVILIGCFLIPVVLILDIAGCVVYAMKAQKGEWAEIPLAGEWARKSALG